MPRQTPLATEIGRVRASLRLTLEEFGELVGIPWQTLAHYESGRAVPAGDRLLKIVYATRRAEKPFRVDRVAREVALAA